MIDVRSFLGYPMEFQKICLIYPPKIKDVIGNSMYAVYQKLLTLSQEEIEDECIEKKVEGQPPTPIQYLMAFAFSNEDNYRITQDAFQFFIHENVILLPDEEKIIIGEVLDIQEGKTIRIIDNAGYFVFQNAVRAALGLPPLERPKEDEDPRVKRMKAKARYRDKIKAKEGKGLSLLTSLASICCMGIGLTPLNIGELSYAAVPLLIRYYQEKDKYETDIKSLLAGADAKKIQLKNWIRNLED